MERCRGLRRCFFCVTGPLREYERQQGIHAMRFRSILLVSFGVFIAVAVEARAADAPPFPVTVEQALATEASTRLPLTPFYDTPTPLPHGEPGALIRAEEATDYVF